MSELLPHELNEIIWRGIEDWVRSHAKDLKCDETYLTRSAIERVRRFRNDVSDTVIRCMAILRGQFNPFRWLDDERYYFDHYMFKLVDLGGRMDEDLDLYVAGLIAL